MERRLIRASMFVDGNNWYHSLRDSGLRDIGRLAYPKIFTKLAGPAREWTQARYYLPDAGPLGNAQVLRDQRAFLEQLRQQDPRIRVVQTGRLEPREAVNEAASELLRYLGELKTRIDPKVFKDLVGIGRAHERTRIFVEKAVDVQLAVDMVQAATAGEFDVAYLLSADGDYTPAVRFVRSCGKKVFSVSTAHCAQLADAANTHIPLEPSWFDDCYIGNPPRRRPEL